MGMQVAVLESANKELMAENDQLKTQVTSLEASLRDAQTQSTLKLEKEQSFYKDNFSTMCLKKE